MAGRRYFQILLYLALYAGYLVWGLSCTSYHRYYSTADDQFSNIYNGYRMTQGEFILNLSHPIGTQSLYAMLFLLTNQDYQFEKTNFSQGRWFYSQGLTLIKWLNFSLLFLVFFCWNRLMRRWGITPVYRWSMVGLLAVNPYLLHHAGYALSIIPYIFCITLVFYNYDVHALGDKWWLLGLTLGWPYYFQFNGLMLNYIIACGLLLDVWRRRLRLSRAIFIICLALLTILPSLVIRQIKVGDPFYHLSMHNFWVERRDREVYQNFRAEYGLDMKNLAGYRLLRELYWQTHTLGQMFKREIKGLGTVFLTVLPSHFGGLGLLLLSVVGLGLAWRERMFVPLLFFLLINIAGLGWLVKSSYSSLFRWSEVIPVLTLPLAALFLQRSARRLPRATLAFLAILVVNVIFLNYQAYPLFAQQATLIVENVPELINHTPFLKEWQFSATETGQEWQLPLHTVNEEGVSFSATVETRVASPLLQTTTTFLNYVLLNIRVDKAAKPVKGKVYLLTNYVPLPSEELVYKILLPADGQFHEYNFYAGRYFSLKENETLRQIIFQPTVEPEAVEMTLRSIKLRF